MTLRAFAIVVAAGILTVSEFSLSVHGQTAPAARVVDIRIETEDEDGLFFGDGRVELQVQLANKIDGPLTGVLRWSWQYAQNDASGKQSENNASELEVSIEAGATEQVLRTSFRLERPGFANWTARFEAKGHDPVSKTFRVGYRPEAIEIPLTAEPDFGSFWKRTLDDLSKVKPRYRLVPKPEQGTESLDVFEIEMRSLGDVCVRGWLEAPKKPGRYPAVLRVPGYGANMKPRRQWDDMIVLSFNVRGHGNSQDDVSGEPRDYWIRGLDDKDEYYYRGAYMDCVRALDYLCSRADVDQSRIAVWGGSQGGGLSLATASLDRRVDLCIPDIAFLCDWVNYFKLTHWPEMNGWIEARDARTWKSTLRTLGYFDTMNMASRIECPTLMSMGLQDEVCPPTTIFAVYNRITADKEYWMYKRRGHGLGRAHYERAWKWIRRAFKLESGEARRG